MRRLAWLIACATITAPAAPCLSAATGGAASGHRAWQTVAQHRLLRALAKFYAAGGKPGAGELGLRPVEWPSLVRGLRQMRLVDLRFPGKSSRRRFVVEGCSVEVARPPLMHRGMMSFVAWRGRRRAAVLVDLDHRALCYSCASATRRFSAILLGPGTTRVTNKPILIWTGHGGLRVLVRVGVLHPPKAKGARWTLTMGMGFAFDPDGPAGLRAGIATIVGVFNQPPAGSLWTGLAPCIGLLRPRSPSARSLGWISMGLNGRHGVGGRGLLFTSGLVGRMAGGGYFSGAFSLRAAPLKSRPGQTLLASYKAPGLAGGVWVRHVDKAFFSKMFRIADIVAASSGNPDRREQYALAHFHSLDKYPRAVAAFLKWVGGGGAAAWYRHQGVRRLRDICKAGLALRGRGGQ